MESSFLNFVSQRVLCKRCRFIVGKDTKIQNNLDQTGAIVPHLMDGYLDKGYSVYADNYYNSFLTSHSTYITGTLRKNRKGLVEML